MLRGIKKMLFANQRRLRFTGLALMTIGLVGFVYVDAVPLRKSLRQAEKAEQELAKEQQLDVKPLQGNVVKMRSRDGGVAGGNAIGQNAIAPANVPVRDVPKQGSFQNGPPGGAPLGAGAPTGKQNAPQGGLGAPNPNQGQPPLVAALQGGVQQLGAPAGDAQVQRPANDAAKPDNVVVAQQGQGAGEMPAGGAPGGQGQPEEKAPIAAGQGLGQPDGQHNGVKLARVPQHREQQIEQPQVEKANEDDQHPIKRAVFQDTHQTLKVRPTTFL